MIILPPLPTLKELSEMEVYEAIQHLKSLQVYVPKPSRPSATNHKLSSGELLELAEQTKVYEEAMIEYREDNGKATIHNIEVDALLNNLICEESGLRTIPEQYQNKVFSYAWSEGHSAGHYEVYNALVELVNIFK